MLYIKSNYEDRIYMNKRLKLFESLLVLVASACIALVAFPQDAEAVSYTHLDVYKRQGRGRELGHGVEQVGQELLALVRNDNDGELIDGSGKGGSHEREYPFAWAAYPPCGINNVSHGTRLL